jgi:hypothetical protein
VVENVFNYRIFHRYRYVFLILKIFFANSAEIYIISTVNNIIFAMRQSHANSNPLHNSNVDPDLI